MLKACSEREDIPLIPSPSLHVSLPPSLPHCKLSTSVSVTGVYRFTSLIQDLSSSMALSIHTLSVLLSSNLHHQPFVLLCLPPTRSHSSSPSPPLQYESAVAVLSPSLICQSDVVIFSFCPCSCPLPRGPEHLASPCLPLTLQRGFGGVLSRTAQGEKKLGLEMRRKHRKCYRECVRNSEQRGRGRWERGGGKRLQTM